MRALAVCAVTSLLVVCGWSDVSSLAWMVNLPGGTASSVVRTNRDGFTESFSRTRSIAQGPITDIYQANIYGQIASSSVFGLVNPVDAGFYANVGEMVVTGPSQAVTAQPERALTTTIYGAIGNVSIGTGNTVPIAMGYSSLIKDEIVVVSYVVNGATILGIVSAESGRIWLSDPSISPTSAAVTPWGEVIATGRDNLSTHHVRISVYDGKFQPFWTETAYTSAIVFHGYVVAVPSSYNNYAHTVYFARNSSSIVAGQTYYQLADWDVSTRIGYGSLQIPNRTVTQICTWDGSYNYVRGSNFVTAFQEFGPVWTKTQTVDRIAADVDGVCLASNPTGSTGVRSLQFDKYDTAGGPLWVQTFSPAADVALAGVKFGNAAMFVSATEGSGTAVHSVFLKYAEGPSLVSVAFATGTVTGGQSGAGTLTLNAPAPVGGRVISLQSRDSHLTVPLTVTISAGRTNATFSYSTTSVTLNTTALLVALDSATGASRSASIIITP